MTCRASIGLDVHARSISEAVSHPEAGAPGRASPPHAPLDAAPPGRLPLKRHPTRRSLAGRPSCATQRDAAWPSAIF